MEERGFFQLNGMGIRKKRTQTSRRPKPDHLHSPSSTPSDGVSKDSSDENADANFTRKEFNLNQCMLRDSTVAEDENSKVRSNDNGQSSTNGKRSSEGVLAPANWKSTSRVVDSELRSASDYGGTNGEVHGSEQSTAVLDASGNDNKVKKVKLKVGSVTRTFHTDSLTNGASSMKNSRSLETSSSWQRQNLQGNTEENHFISDKRTGLQGVPWKDFASGGFSLGKEDFSMGKTPGKGSMGKQVDKSEPIRKSKRVSKRRVMDEEFGEEDDDDEIRYLEKLRTSKVTVGYKYEDEEFSKKHRKLSTMENGGALRLARDEKKKSRPDRAREDAEYEEEEELVSDSELEGNKKQNKESVESLMEGKREITLTNRQRALLSSKHGISAPDANAIEFPNGLPPAPSRKQKEKLTEVEQQLKKTEAAQRRRMQVEKAARESEAEAIKKILGQDSSRKKREEKNKKRQEELAQERAANAMILGSNTIRCVMSPTGTVLTFSEDMGLPSIFDPKPYSYPPPREKCAGPSCANPYKYRDSKSKLPLCSLHCYKAVQEKMLTETSC